MADYTKPLRNVLDDSGWQFHRRGKGSHDIWINPSTSQIVSVPIKIKSKQTANSILKKHRSNKDFRATRTGNSNNFVKQLGKNTNLSTLPCE